MWIASKFGWFSIVKEKSGPGFMVRARSRADLEQLTAAVAACNEEKLPAIIETPEADYRFRIVIGNSQLWDVMEALVESVDYSNFKGEIAKTKGQRDKLEPYHRIWSVMAGYQADTVHRLGSGARGWRDIPK